MEPSLLFNNKSTISNHSKRCDWVWQGCAGASGQDDPPGGHCTGGAAAIPHVCAGVPYRHRRAPVTQADLSGVD